MFRLFGALAAAALLVFVGAGLYLSSRDWNRYRDSIANQLSLRLGLPVAIEGQVDLVLFFAPELRVRDVVVSGTLEEGERLAHFGSLELRMDLTDLARGAISFDRIELRDVALQLRVAADGQPNWARPAREPRDQKFELDTYFRGDHALVERAEIVYRDELCESTSRIALDRADLRREGDDIHVAARGSVDGLPFDLQGITDPLLRLASSRRPFALDLEGRAGAAFVGITGRIAKPADLSGVELYLRGDAPGLGAFSELVGRELPDLGPVGFSALISDSAGSWSSDSVQLEIGRLQEGWLRVAGSVRGAECGFGLSLDGNFRAPSLAVLSPLVPPEFPDFGSVDLSFEIDDREGTIAVERFEVHAQREEALDLRLRGRLDDVREFDELAVQVDLQAADLSVVGSLLGRALPPLGPVSVQMHAVGSDEKTRASDARFAIGRSTFSADLVGRYVPGERRSLEGYIRSGVLDVAELTEVVLGGDAEPQVPREQFFSSEPIGFQRLTALDAVLDLHLDRVVGIRGLDLDQLRADLHLENGALDVAPIELIYQEARVDAETRIEAERDGGSLSVVAKARGLDLHRLLSRFQERPSLSGRLDASLDLRGRGASPREIASTLEGRVQLLLEDGTIEARYANALIIDLIDKLSSDEDQQEHVALHCFFADLEIRQGRVETRALVLDSDDVVLHGEGSLDLGHERIDLEVTPTPKDPGVLSLSAPVRVAGSLLIPEIGVRKLDMVAESAGDIASALGGSIVDWFTGRGEEERPEETRACDQIAAELAAPGA